MCRSDDPRQRTVVGNLKPEPRRGKGNDGFHYVDPPQFPLHAAAPPASADSHTAPVGGATTERTRL